MKKIAVIIMVLLVTGVAHGQKKVKTYGQPQPYGNSKTKKARSSAEQRAANAQAGRNGPVSDFPADSQKTRKRTGIKRK